MLAIDYGKPTVMRFYAIAFSIMVFAALRFSGCKAVLVIWRTNTAISVRSRDIKLKSRPVIKRTAPLVGVTSQENGISRF